MSLLSNLREHQQDSELLKILKRQASALERIADSLDLLIPSSLTESDIERKLSAKPSGVESFRIYDQRQAYRDEQIANQEEARRIIEELEAES